MFYKKLLKIALVTFSLIVVYFFSAMVVYDPLQVLHKPWFRQESFIDNMRDQALGIINNYDFDSIILGNSMLENTSSDEASQKIGGKFVNISSSGMLYAERYVLTKYALERKTLKNVIWVLDSYFLSPMPYSDSFSPESYADKKDQQLRLYFNTRYAWCILTWSRSKKCIGKRGSLDRPAAWMESARELFGDYTNVIREMSVEKKKNLEKQLEEIAASGVPEEKRVSLEKISQAEKVVDEYMFSLAKAYPDTKFSIVIPPYSLLHWVIKNDPSFDFSMYRLLVERIMTKASVYPNIRFFWFYDEDFVADLSRYKDDTHYDDSVNSLFLKAISDETHTITFKNVSSAFKRLEQKIRKFDVFPVLQMIKKDLEK